MIVSFLSVDLDYRLDKRDGQYKLLDFNPRIGANFRMFENSAGVDVVRALHLDLSGKAVSLAQAVEGRKFLVENCDLLASMGYMRRGDLSIGSWWRSLQGKKEFAWFSMDDPDPFLSMFVRQGTVLTALACRKLWRHVFSPTPRHNRSPAGVLSSPVLELMQEPASKQPVAR